MNIEEAITEVENYLDYEGSISITAIATLYTAYEKEQEKNKELEKQLQSTYQKQYVIEEYGETIEKQSKEIEELKDKCKELIFEKQELTSALLDSTPNDKIKAKIEEYEEQEKDEPDAFLCKRVLQSLLEKE